jgi:hypothetical protein
MALSNQDRNANENQKYNYLVAGGILRTNQWYPSPSYGGENNYNIQMCYAIWKAQLKALDKEIAEKRVPIDEAFNFRLIECDAQRDACKNPNPKPLYDPAGDAARNAKCEQEYNQCILTAEDKHSEELGKLSVYEDTQLKIILSQRVECVRRIKYPPVPPTPTFA